MNSMKRQNNRILKEELPRSIGAQYATGDQWRNNSRKNEGMDPKQKEYPVVDVTSNRSTSNRIDRIDVTGMGEFNSDDHYIYYCG